MQFGQISFSFFLCQKKTVFVLKIQIDFIVRVWWGTLIFSILPVRSYAMEHCFSFNNHLNLIFTYYFIYLLSNYFIYLYIANYFVDFANNLFNLFNVIHLFIYCGIFTFLLQSPKMKVSFLMFFISQ